jgi:hypothetical protein
VPHGVVQRLLVSLGSHPCGYRPERKLRHSSPAAQSTSPVH